MNVVLLGGHLSGEPRRHALVSGTELVRWELTTDVDGQRLTVPVAWFDPPAWASRVGLGEEVVVSGVVRRRFYRADGSTRSSTEVVTVAAAPARQRVRAARVRDETLRLLGVGEG